MMIQLIFPASFWPAWTIYFFHHVASKIFQCMYVYIRGITTALMPPCLPKNKKHQRALSFSRGQTPSIYTFKKFFAISIYPGIIMCNSSYTTPIIWGKWLKGRKPSREHHLSIAKLNSVKNYYSKSPINDLVKWLEWENQAESGYFGKEIN